MIGASPITADEELERLWRFLLDELSETERVALEDELLVDDAGFALVESAEDELIDAYVRCELSAGRRLRFEQHFATTPSRRARVELAHALATLAAATTTPATTTPATTAPATTTPAPSPLATTSAIAGTARPLREGAPARPRRRQLVAQAAAAALLLGALGTLGPRLLHRPQGPVVEETLSADSRRGDTAAPTVRLPAHTARLRLRLVMAESLLANGAGFDVLVRREDEPPRSLAATRPARDALSVDLEGAGLLAGSYELTARAHRPGGAVDELAVYAFRLDAH